VNIRIRIVYSLMALAGLRVVELAGLAPGPFAGMLLADFGADVVRVDRWPNASSSGDVLDRGKRSIAIDLKHPQGTEVVRRLAEQADVLIEPFRPGVMERLGLGPAELHRVNPRLIYARLTGFGQEGYYAQRAGHDINYIAVAGALSLIGRKGQNPTIPGNILGDFAGGGMLCAFGILLALIERAKSGKGQVFDAAMVDGVSYLTAFVHNLKHAGLWNNETGANTLDSGAPFYDTYRTKDGRFVAVGALEPRFYAKLAEGLGLAGEESLPDQMDVSQWPVLRERFTKIFLSRTRDEWAKIFDGVDACVTPVLDLSEVMDHPHNKDRTLLEENQESGRWEARPAPRLSRTPGHSLKFRASPTPGQHTKEVLREYGFQTGAISGMLESGAVGEHGIRKAAL